MQGNIISKRNPYLLDKNFNKSKKLKYMSKLSNIIELLEPIQSSGIPEIKINEFNTTFTLEESSLSMNIEPNTKYSIKLKFYYDSDDYNYITYTITSSNQKTLTIEHNFSDTDKIKIIIEFLSSSKITITTDSNYNTELNFFNILEINKINISENYSSYKIKSDNCLFKQGTDGLQKINVNLPATINGYFIYASALFIVTSNGLYRCANPYEPITLVKDNIYYGPDSTMLLIAPHTIRRRGTINDGMLYDLNYTGKLIVYSDSDSHFYSSQYGTSWTQCSFEDVQDNSYFYCTWMSYVNNKYFMNTNVGLYYSTNAVNWYKTDLTTKLNVTMIDDDMMLNWYNLAKLIFYDSKNSKYILSLVKYDSVGVAYHKTCISTNGTNWVVYPTDNNDDTYITSVSKSNGVYLSTINNLVKFTDANCNYKAELWDYGQIHSIFSRNTGTTFEEYAIITSEYLLKTKVTINGTSYIRQNPTIVATFNTEKYPKEAVGYIGDYLFYLIECSSNIKLYRFNNNGANNSNNSVDCLELGDNVYTETIDTNNGPNNYFNISQENYSIIPVIKRYVINNTECMYILNKNYSNNSYVYSLYLCTTSNFTKVLEFSYKGSYGDSYEISKYSDSQFLIHFKLKNANKYYITSNGINFTELDSSLFPDENLGPLAYYNGICFAPPNSGFENKQYMYMHGQPPEIEGYTEVT